MVELNDVEVCFSLMVETKRVGNRLSTSCHL